MRIRLKRVATMTNKTAKRWIFICIMTMSRSKMRSRKKKRTR